MSDALMVIPIVEGHGEVECIRLLLERLWYEETSGTEMKVLTPLRMPRGQMVNPEIMDRQIELAARKLLQEPFAGAKMILILADADEDLPCALGPDILKNARKKRADMDISVVMACREFETWFVASSDVAPLSTEFENIDASAAESAEAARRGKRWVQDHTRRRYSETADMPRFVRAMNLKVVRARCPSFDKLCRELERRH